MFKRFTILMVIVFLIGGCSGLMPANPTSNPTTIPATSMVTIPAISPTKTPTSVPPSGIEGQVTKGPTCPGPVPINGSTECADRPYQATLAILDANNREVTRFQTDTNGYFKTILEPGTYTIHPISQNMLPHAADQSVIVYPGQFTQVTVMFDTGMR
jgi:hypothetical protein